MKDDIINHRTMCDLESKNLQAGMHFKLPKQSHYSVLLMSQLKNAPYQDKLGNDGLLIEYQGHDVPNSKKTNINPKITDQSTVWSSGKLTENGRFVEAVDAYKAGKQSPRMVKLYEKIREGIWSIKGLFYLMDYRYEHDGQRYAHHFQLKLIEDHPFNQSHTRQVNDHDTHNRVIPSSVKLAVYQRDKGACVLCGSKENLHFDHDVPFSKGGSSITEKNIRLLCLKHNLSKSDRIE